MERRSLTPRLKREMQGFISDPPHGISCHLVNNSTSDLCAGIIGPPGSPYEGGLYKLNITLAPDYPFQPPRVLFETPIMHPNIDESGRICLDVLKLPPVGSWRCSNTLSSVLVAIQCLMGAPNPSDPLNPNAAELMLLNKDLFMKEARAHMMRICNIPDVSDNPINNIGMKSVFAGSPGLLTNPKKIHKRCHSIANMEKSLHGTKKPRQSPLSTTEALVISDFEMNLDSDKNPGSIFTPSTSAAEPSTSTAEPSTSRANPSSSGAGDTLDTDDDMEVDV